MLSLEKGQASEILKEILQRGGNPYWSLDLTALHGFELHLKPKVLTLDTLKKIVKEKGFECKEGTGEIIVF